MGLIRKLLHWDILKGVVLYKPQKNTFHVTFKVVSDETYFITVLILPENFTHQL